jgi:hypothetical protein
MYPALADASATTDASASTVTTDAQRPFWHSVPGSDGKCRFVAGASPRRRAHQPGQAFLSFAFTSQPSQQPAVNGRKGGGSAAKTPRESTVSPPRHDSCRHGQETAADYHVGERADGTPKGSTEGRAFGFSIDNQSTRSVPHAPTSLVATRPPFTGPVRQRKSWARRKNSAA